MTTSRVREPPAESELQTCPQHALAHIERDLDQLEAVTRAPPSERHDVRTEPTSTRAMSRILAERDLDQEPGGGHSPPSDQHVSGCCRVGELQAGCQVDTHWPAVAAELATQTAAPSRL